MHPLRLWSLPKPNLAARLLAPLGWIYGAVTAARMSGQGARLSVPVICVGNFTLGGAGKTPTCLMLAQMLIDAGHRPVFVSRGYGGALSSKAPVLVSLERHTSAEVGDEPLLLARLAPCFICTDRLAAAQAAIAAAATVIILDDGLQNPKLAKTFSLAVVDAQAGFGNGLCFPAGPLRAPLKAQLRHVDAVIFIGKDVAENDRLLARLRPDLHSFSGALVPDAAIAAGLSGQRVFAFAGIGRPEKFFQTLRETGADVVATQSFPDHHEFSAKDMESLAKISKSRGVIPVTTQKDAMRLPPRLRDNVVALPVTLHLRQAAQLLALVQTKIQAL